MENRFHLLQIILAGGIMIMSMINDSTPFAIVGGVLFWAGITALTGGKKNGK